MAGRGPDRRGAAQSLSRHARPLIVGLPGHTLDSPIAAELRALNPLGIILFARNIEAPDQLAALTAAARAALGRDDAPVLIDQEGGRVARLKGEHFRHPPPARTFGALWDVDSKTALRAAFLNARLIAHELAALGIDVDCAPVCDVPGEGMHEAIGDRAFHPDPHVVAALARATARGLLAGGVQPVMKHMPGQGRARADSHLELPVVDAGADALARDAIPFRALADDVPWGMTAHVLYPALDPANCATLSARIIAEAVRQRIGFHGVLVSDDLRMKALTGTIAVRAGAALAAGCDLALECAPGPEDWPSLHALPPMRPSTWRRLRRARRLAARSVRPFDPGQAADEVGALLARV
jgi:beta-N-acetylhexosaminidase